MCITLLSHVILIFIVFTLIVASLLLWYTHPLFFICTSLFLFFEYLLLIKLIEEILALHTFKLILLSTYYVIISMYSTKLNKPRTVDAEKPLYCNKVHSTGSLLPIIIIIINNYCYNNNQCENVSLRKQLSKFYNKIWNSEIVL